MQHIWKKEETKFIERTFNGHSKVRMPEFQRLAGNTQARQEDYYAEYEPLRCLSMEQHLRKGDVLFDIGVSDGWLSAIYAQFVGAENMCLFEPTAQVWPNIKAVWDANELPTPRSTFYGFVSDTTKLSPSAPHDISLNYRDGWPESAYPSDLMEEMMFRSLLSTGNSIPQTTIDDFISKTGIVPRGISIDVEGAEFLVLKGAEKTLKTHRPLIWLSLHDVNGALTYDYHTTKDEVFGWLKERGYQMEYLEVCGDSHWFLTARA